MVSRTRSIRSATAPAIGLNTTAGARSQKATMPTQKALPVISQASQDTAMRCTQSPVQEISEAAKNSLASWCDSARPSAPRLAASPAAECGHGRGGQASAAARPGILLDALLGQPVAFEHPAQPVGLRPRE